MSTLLDQLCERVGVLPGYHDIWGGFHQTPDATKRALLASMGLPADSDDEAAASLQQFDRRQWARPLPPVMVVREPAPPHRIPIVLPLADETRRYRWRLRRESGAEDSAECVPAELDVAGRAELDGRVNEIRAQIDKSTSDYDKEKLQERLAKLAGGGARVNVAAATTTGNKGNRAPR